MTPAACGAFAPLRDRPGADLGLAGREERDEPEQLVARADDGVEPRLRQPRAREELGAVGRIELGDLRLERGADRDDGAPSASARRFERLEVLVAVEVRERSLVDVGDVEGGLRREEVHLAHDDGRVGVVRAA